MPLGMGWGGEGRGAEQSLTGHLGLSPPKEALENSSLPKEISVSSHRNVFFFFFPHIKKFPFYTGFSIWTCFFDHLILGHKKIICLSAYCLNLEFPPQTSQTPSAFAQLTWQENLAVGGSWVMCF